MIARIDHVSIAVKDYDKAEKFFTEILGAEPGLGGDDHSIKFYWQIYSLGDLTRLELIRPNAEGSFLENFMATRGGGVHHMTLETPDIKKFKEMLDEKGIPNFGYNDARSEWKELFIHPKDAFGILIQVAEFQPDPYLPQSRRMKPGSRWITTKSDDGCELTVAHVGGGKVDISLNKDEIKSLIKDLEAFV